MAGSNTGGGEFPPLQKSLCQLKIRVNVLLSVPRAVCDASLRNLEKLDLSKNRLEAVPVEVENLGSCIQRRPRKNVSLVVPLVRLFNGR